MHANPCIPVLLAILIAGVVVADVFSSETIESMATRVAVRLEAIDAVEFTFRVRSNSFGSPDMRETRQEYAFFRSKDINYPRSWERWKVFYKKKPGKWDLDRFVAFNGKTVWTWDRIDPALPGEFYKWSRGALKPSYLPKTIWVATSSMLLINFLTFFC